MRTLRAYTAGLLSGFCLAGTAGAQLRVVEWNVSNYSSGRVSAFATAIHGVNPGNGLSMAPDVIVGQEFLSAGGVTNFLEIVNEAPGSPGDWEAAPFINGPDTDNAFFYRRTKIDFLGVTVVAKGGPAPNHPRDVERYDVRLVGYAAPSAVIACYSSHMKAGTGSDDRARRLLEAQRIRDDTAGLADGWNFLVAGDLNIRASTESAYAALVGPPAGGRLFDPIASPGDWNNNGAFRFVHTQDPVGAGGMDDRYDQILVSASLIDGDGADYIGDADEPYSVSTWDDPEHSHRAWGNDGTTFNGELRVAGNAMVGPVIAQALKDCADGAGHLPVFLDIRVPAVVISDEMIDFGQVETGDVVELPLAVANAGDIALWGASGINDLTYTLTAPEERIEVPFGPFGDPAGGAGNEHVVTLDASGTGEINAVILIESNAPDEPTRAVTVTADIVSACPADIDGDGTVDVADLLAVLAAWGRAGVPEDIDGSGTVDFGDLLVILAAWGPCA